MAKPQWTYPSNTNLATIKERIQTTVPILVFDNEDRSTVETKNFTTEVDSTILPIYSNSSFFWVKSKGLAQTAWIGEPSGYNRYTPLAQNYVFKFPRDQITINGDHTTVVPRLHTNTPTNGFFGVAIDGVPFKSTNSGKQIVMNQKTYTENSYIYPLQDFFTDGSGIIGPDRQFYYQTDPRLIYTKDSSKHSPIIGYAFDGNPIYGPYGYVDPLPHTVTGPDGKLIIEGNPALKVMESSYRITEVQRSNGTLPDGTYIEDFVYENGLGDLDEHNGRYCKTPEYPGGTYAYFITVDPYDVTLPRYPYIIGPTYYQEPLIPNGSLPFPGEITLEVISGTIPRGMRIQDLTITGVPFEVDILEKYRFVLRAINADGFSDRTYSITVDGPTIPAWETPAGDLEIGASGQRSTLNVQLLKTEATSGSTRLQLASVFGLKVDSVVTCDNYPGAILTDTKIIKIDYVNKFIYLDKPLQSIIPTLYYPPSPLYKFTVYSVGSNLGLQNTLVVNSIDNLLVGDIIVDSSLTKYLALGTIIQSIDFEGKILTLSKPLLQTIPNGTKFFASHPNNTEINCTYTFYHTNLFVLDNQYVDYQLNAIDSDTAAGATLTYSIPPNGGTLPLGLSLSSDGVISGFTSALLANEQVEDNGNYDMQLYDKYAYDYGVRPYNGFDSFLYDTTIYDYWNNTITPRKLNRYYEFKVRITDSANGLYSDRKFRIFVIGDTYFRADTTVLQVGNSIYTTDVSAIRSPYWLSPSYLGKRRANNYITTLLEVFVSPTLSGVLGFVLDPVNDDGTPSILPPGMQLDQIAGYIYGDVPYQPAVTKTYKFTVRAINYDPANPIYSHAAFTTQNISAGQYTLYVDSVSDIEINSLITQPPGTSYITPGSVISGIDVHNKTITLNTPILTTIPSGTRFLFSYLASTAKTFTIDILGQVDSTIQFITPGNLGTIPANFISQLSVVAKTTVPNAVLNYTLMGGSLPPGLTLVNDGTIQGKVNQYATTSNPGLTSFDGNKTTFDKFNTTIDRDYKFIVLAQDQFKLSAVTKVFTVSITTPNNLLYSNLYVKPFLTSTKRSEIASFFSNTSIFDLSMIYRSSDPEFGIQSQLKMLLYAGIQTKDAAEYAAALNRSSKKRYRFGSVKKAIGKTPGTNNIVYEVIYVEILDDLENSNGSVSSQISTRFLDKKQSVNQGRRDTWDAHPDTNVSDNLLSSAEDTLPRIWMQDKILSTDQGSQKVSDINKTSVFGNSTTNIRTNISNIGDTERNFLPLWMRTAQTYSGVAQGFTKAVVLCYALPGYGDTIINNIKNLGIDFKNIDFTVDRVIIDSVEGQVGDKYIAFGAREIING